MSIKFCINCIFCVPSDISDHDPEFSKCSAERITSLVTGLPTPAKHLEYCSIERKAGKKCGPDASRFVGKEMPHV